MKQITLLTLISVTLPAFATNRNANATASAAPLPQSADAGRAAIDEKTASAAMHGLSAVQATPNSTELDAKKANALRFSQHFFPFMRVMQRMEGDSRAAADPQRENETAQLLATALRQANARFDQQTGKIYLGNTDTPWPMTQQDKWDPAKHLRVPLDQAIFLQVPLCVGVFLDAGAPVNIIDPLYGHLSIEIAIYKMFNAQDGSPKKRALCILKMYLHAGGSHAPLEGTPEADVLVPAKAQVAQEKAQNQLEEDQVKTALVAYDNTFKDLSPLVCLYAKQRFEEYAAQALGENPQASPATAKK